MARTERALKHSSWGGKDGQNRAERKAVASSSGRMVYPPRGLFLGRFSSKLFEMIMLQTDLRPDPDKSTDPFFKLAYN